MCIHVYTCIGLEVAVNRRQVLLNSKKLTHSYW